MFKKVKVFAFSFLAILVTLSCLTPINAISNYSIDIKVWLQPNGDAYIEEVWNMYVDKGTEIYKDESQLRDSHILDLKVKDSNGNEYTTVDNWNTSLSFEQKKYKAGLNKTSSGYEICWGISQYGANQYTVSYTMTNFINSYEDYDGFNQRLVNDEMSDPPQKVSVYIYSNGVKLTDENTVYQGFGFSGNLDLYNDYLQVTSTKSLSENNHVTLTMRFDKGMFSPQNVVNKSFDEVEKEANEGKSKSATSFISMLPFFIGPAIFGVIAIVFIYITRFYMSAKNVKKCHIPDRDIGYFRDIPFDGDLIPTYFVLSQTDKLKNDTDIIAAYLLRWMLNKNIRIEMATKVGFFKTKESPSIIFENTQGITELLEMKLYTMLQSAAGSDHILQEDEFEDWAREHYSRVDGLISSIKMRGEDYFTEKDYISTYKKTGMFGLLHTTQRGINEAGIERVKEVLGLKDYLNEFTLINERQAVEVYLWKDYLIYASLFGIASEVREQFQNIYPKYFEEYIPYYTNPYQTMIMINHMTHSFHHGYTAGFESSHASTFTGGGGGGGFSGGGSGGGVR